MFAILVPRTPGKPAPPLGVEHQQVANAHHFGALRPSTRVGARRPVDAHGLRGIKPLLVRVNGKRQGGASSWN